jgi:Uma2 family endonuclease
MGMTAVRGIPAFSQSLLEDLDRVGRKHQRWTVQAYFELDGNYQVEYCRGTLDILPMPTIDHQRVAQRINAALLNFVAMGGAKGEVLFSGTRVEVGEEVYREPDVLFIPQEWLGHVHKQYTERAGLVVEVVSDSNRDHDLRTKRIEYAQAAIPEYWIVDPDARQITVLKLDRDFYVTHGKFGDGEQATSAYLTGFSIDVAGVFGAAG